MGSLLARFLVGALAGICAWAVMEPFAPKLLDSPEWGRWEGIFILVYGLLVGLAIGGLDGFVRGGKVHTIRGLGLGLVFGAVGGLFGYDLGGSLEMATFGAQAFSASAPLPEAMMARAIVFVPLGFFVGAAIGFSSLTWKRTIQGAIGGAIGAGIGGFAFDVIGKALAPTILRLQGQTQGEVGGPSRAIAFTLTAACIALFIGLVERFSRSAWLRLNLGRNEGKEWSIDAAQTFIGRSESAGVPLLGDPNVAPIHASIQKNGNQYFITDGGSPIGTYVNGQRIQQAALAPGSAIQIGSFVLQFLIKGTPAPQMAPEAYRGQAYSPAPQAAGPNPYAAPAPSAYPSQPQPISNQTVAYPAQAAPATAMFGVTALDGPMAGQRFPLQAVIEVGREGAGIRLASDQSASRRHATLAPAFSGVTVTDLNSTNGTFVNGQRVQSAEAKPGDVIKIGGTSFRVEAG